MAIPGLGDHGPLEHDAVLDIHTFNKKTPEVPPLPEVQREVADATPPKANDGYNEDRDYFNRYEHLDVIHKRAYDLVWEYVSLQPGEALPLDWRSRARDLVAEHNSLKDLYGIDEEDPEAQADLLHDLRPVR